MPKPKSDPNPPTPNPSTERRRRLKTLRARLEVERTTLAPWMTKLKRAFHSVEKLLARVGRLEKEIAKLENA